MSIWILCPFLNRVVVLVPSCKSSLYILDIRPFLDICLTNTFSHSVSCPLTFPAVSFKTQNFNSDEVQFTYFCFPLVTCAFGVCKGKRHSGASPPLSILQRNFVSDTTCVGFPHIKQFCNTSWVSHDLTSLWHYLPGVSVRSHKLRARSPETTLPPPQTSVQSWGCHWYFWPTGCKLEGSHPRSLCRFN